jgi:hypothetical protein
MSKRDTDHSDDEVPIVAEAYGVKIDLKSRPADLGEEVPSRWRDVPGLLNKHLMRLAVAPTRLITELLEGATRLVRGLSRIPDSVAKRMERAHAEADASERERQHVARERKNPQFAPTPAPNLLTSEVPNDEGVEAALAKIQAVLQKYKARGFDAYIMFGPDGKPIIVCGTPPGSETQIVEAIEKIKELQNAPVEDDR